MKRNRSHSLCRLNGESQREERERESESNIEHIVKKTMFPLRKQRDNHGEGGKWAESGENDKKREKRENEKSEKSEKSEGTGKGEKKEKRGGYVRKGDRRGEKVTQR